MTGIREKGITAHITSWAWTYINQHKITKTEALWEALERILHEHETIQKGK